jgi:D-ornithine 4,5-aminomutase subunit beta
MYNIEGLDNAKQALTGMDDLQSLVKIDMDGPVGTRAREIQERAILFLEDVIKQGGFFEAANAGSFVDSGQFPARNGDGIARDINGGVGAGTVFERDADYMAPVTGHFGNNDVKQYGADEKNPSELIGGCSFEDRSKIVYIDELDPVDNVNVRMDETEKYRSTTMTKPEVE